MGPAPAPGGAVGGPGNSWSSCRSDASILTAARATGPGPWLTGGTHPPLPARQLPHGHREHAPPPADPAPIPTPDAPPAWPSAAGGQPLSRSRTPPTAERKIIGAEIFPSLLRCRRCHSEGSAPLPGAAPTHLLTHSGVKHGAARGGTPKGLAWLGARAQRRAPAAETPVQPPVTVGIRWAASPEGSCPGAARGGTHRHPMGTPLGQAPVPGVGGRSPAPRW